MSVSACKVISIYFGKRHKPPTNGEEMLKLAKFIYEKELEVDPGVDMDTIIVNNQAGFGPGNKYLNSLNGKETLRGKIRVLHRKNVGISFGAFSYTFKKFRNEYEYWFFTEEDIVPIKEGYMANCIEKLNSDEKLSFVSVSGLGIDKGKLHAHGANGCSSSKYLGEVFDKMGKLPHYEGVPKITKWKKDVRKHLDEGEIKFTNIFIEMGYKITDLTYGNKIINLKSKQSPISLRKEIWEMFD